MAQSNVAREPSMDEILASIRKIIESNEPGIPGFPANDIGPAQDDGYRGEGGFDSQELDDIHLTIDDEMLIAEFEAEIQQPLTAVEPVVQAQQAPIHAGEAIRQPSPQPVPTPPTSLADVAARVRAASERHVPSRDSIAPEAATQPDAKADTFTAKPAQAPEPVEKLESVAKVQPQAEPHFVDVEPQAAPENVVAQPASTPVAAIGQTDIAALISPAVSKQVARSFDDLAFAVDSSSRRSFDEIAEDMLRPMLQEWLDDNLPTLVERLVREEIERVARGPRR